MNTRDYLSRISYSGDVIPSSSVLADLQEAHLLAVPFENLDIHLKRTISLDLNHLFTKVVTQKRGGFCYELNTLFYTLLSESGFRVKLASGRVYNSASDTFGPEFDHMLILAEVENRTWIVDVGFGDFSMRPLPLQVNQPIMDSAGQFLVEQEDGTTFKVSRFSPDNGGYIPAYLFSTVERRIGDFSTMCRYHQSSPESHFTQRKVCSLATRTGRVTLTDDSLIVTNNGVKNAFPVRSGQGWNTLLAHHFNIIL